MLLLVLVVAAALTGVVVVAASRVRRLDHLHRRVDAAGAALDAALQRRAALAGAAARAFGAGSFAGAGAAGTGAAPVGAAAAGECLPVPAGARAAGADRSPQLGAGERSGGSGRAGEPAVVAGPAGVAAARAGEPAVATGEPAVVAGRAGVAAGAAGPAGEPAVGGLAAAATTIGPDREAAANRLSRALAAVDRGLLPADLAAELADAEQLLLLARRVHNDAVRDTLALRTLRMVRWLHLAGTAPMPTYFEMAEPPPGAALRIV